MAGANPAFSIATLSGIYFIPTMTKPENIFASVIITAFGLGILAGPVAGYFIDKATAEQCRTHDWPKETDQIHRDWCITNGYNI